MKIFLPVLNLSFVLQANQTFVSMFRWPDFHGNNSLPHPIMESRACVWFHTCCYWINKTSRKIGNANLVFVYVPLKYLEVVIYLVRLFFKITSFRIIVTSASFWLQNCKWLRFFIFRLWGYMEITIGSKATQLKLLGKLNSATYRV